jgi:hypothetical protein
MKITGTVIVELAAVFVPLICLGSVSAQAALGAYELRFNGQKVGSDVLTPGWSDFNNIFDHYTFGSAGQYLYSAVGGISPASPGYQTILIAGPEPSGYTGDPALSASSNRPGNVTNLTDGLLGIGTETERGCFRELTLAGSADRLVYIFAPKAIFERLNGCI